VPSVDLGEPILVEERPVLGLRHRLVLAGVFPSDAIAVPVAVSASGPGSPPGNPASPLAPAASAGTPAGTRSGLAALAGAAGIGASRAAMHQGDGDVRQR